MGGRETVGVDRTDMEAVDFEIESVYDPKSDWIRISVGSESFPSVGSES